MIVDLFWLLAGLVLVGASPLAAYWMGPPECNQPPGRRWHHRKCRDGLHHSSCPARRRARPTFKGRERC